MSIPIPVALQSILDEVYQEVIFHDITERYTIHHLARRNLKSLKCESLIKKIRARGFKVCDITRNQYYGLRTLNSRFGGVEVDINIYNDSMDKLEIELRTGTRKTKK